MSQAYAVRTPSQAYADGAAAGRWRDDPAQHPALRELDRVQRELLAATKARGRKAAKPEAETVKMGGKSLYTISWKGSRVSLKFGKQVVNGFHVICIGRPFNTVCYSLYYPQPVSIGSSGNAHAGF